MLLRFQNNSSISFEKFQYYNDYYYTILYYTVLYNGCLIYKYIHFRLLLYCDYFLYHRLLYFFLSIVSYYFFFFCSFYIVEKLYILNFFHLVITLTWDKRETRLSTFNYLSCSIPSFN